MNVLTQSIFEGERRMKNDRRARQAFTYAGIERRCFKERRSNEDRRIHKRYRPAESTFLELKDGKRIVGEVLDVSLGGLSSLYLGNEDIEGKKAKISLFESSRGFLLRDIPVMITSHFGMFSMSPFSTTPTSRFGVRFRNLTDEQQNQVAQFIANHTV